MWFEMPIWSAGDVVRRVVRFKERPKISDIVGLHTVYEFTLDVSARNLWSADIVELLSFYSPDALIVWSDRLHQIEHVQMPGITIFPADLPWR